MIFHSLIENFKNEHAANDDRPLDLVQCSNTTQTSSVLFFKLDQNTLPGFTFPMPSVSKLGSRPQNGSQVKNVGIAH